MCQSAINFYCKNAFMKYYLNLFLAKSTPVYAKSQVTKKTKADGKEPNNL